MKIGILFDGFDLPPKNGVTYRLYYLSKKIREMGQEVVFFMSDRGFVADETLLKEPFTFHLFSPKTFYEDHEFVRKFIVSEKIDILQVNNSQSVLWYGAGHAEALNIPLITEMHDCDATICKTLGEKSDKVNKMKFVQYAGGVLSDEIICMTQGDLNELTSDIGIFPEKITLIPNGIDTDFFPYSQHSIDNRNIIFLGNMFYEPNREAAEKIISDIMPKINATLVCVGMADELFINKFSGNDIRFTGAVDDIRPYLKEASLAVAPILSGSGMKVKMLNFASSGLPIITTSTGVAGYPADIAIVEDDISKYPEIINDFLRDENRGNELGHKARKLVESNFSWQTIAAKVISVYKRARHHSFRGDIIPKRLGEFPGSYEIVESKEAPLPMWLEEERVKHKSNAPKYRKIIGTINNHD